MSVTVHCNVHSSYATSSTLKTFIEAVATRAKEDGISFKDAFAGEATKPHTHEADFLQATRWVPFHTP